MTWLLLLAALSACAPEPARARSTWVGERVEEYRKTLPALDDLPSHPCPGPPDDALLFRMMDHDIWSLYYRDEAADQIYSVMMGTFRSTILPYNSDWGFRVRSPYGVALDLWYYSDIYSDPAQQFQGERSYDVGLSWPADPSYMNIGLEHTLSGAADRYNSVTVSEPKSWDSASWNPEDYFYPVADCLSHVRPDRAAGWFWMDPAQAGNYSDTISTPVWFVWDAGAACVIGSDDLEYNYASTSERSGYRKGPNGLVGLYYDGLTPADVWPHLKDASGGGG